MAIIESKSTGAVPYDWSASHTMGHIAALVRKLTITSYKPPPGTVSSIPPSVSPIARLIASVRTHLFRDQRTISPHRTIPSCPLSTRYPSLPAVNPRHSSPRIFAACAASPICFCGNPKIMHFPSRAFRSESHREEGGAAGGAEWDRVRGGGRDSSRGLVIINWMARRRGKW